MLHRITLHLARTPDHPDGSDLIGYDLIAPLDRSGHLDPIAWQHLRPLCQVRRFVPGEPERHGRLIHRAGGAGGATWLFDFDPDTTSDDEGGHRLETHAFRAGDYVSIGNSRRCLRTFRIVDVHPIRERLGRPPQVAGETPGRQRVRVPR